MADSQQKSNADKSEIFDGLIKEAMVEISDKQFSVNSSFQLPAISPYLVGLLLIISFFYNQPKFNDTHANPTNNSFESGQRVGLLTIAENIDAYQRKNGELPKKMPSALSNVLRVDYKKLGTNHYELTMPTSDGLLVLNRQGALEEIYLESDKS